MVKKDLMLQRAFEHLPFQKTTLFYCIMLFKKLISLQAQNLITGN